MVEKLRRLMDAGAGYCTTVHGDDDKVAPLWKDV